MTELTSRAIRDSFTNYIQTIHGMVAFLITVSNRPSADSTLSFSLGRRMTTSPTNRVTPSGPATPDQVIQVGDRLGYVVEATRSLGASSENWTDEIDQLRKYDDDLVGWWTPNGRLGKSNVVLLLWTEFAKKFARLMDERLKDAGDCFSRPTSVMSFSELSRNSDAIFLVKEWGDLDDDATVRTELADGHSVTLRSILASRFGRYRFYADRPITEYVMVVLWQDIFTQRAVETEYDESLKAYAFEADVGELASSLQKLFGSEGNEEREREYPQRSWVREAMDAFVTLGLAGQLGTDRYLVRFRELRKHQRDIAEYFAQHRGSVKEEEGASTQLGLFDVDEAPTD